MDLRVLYLQESLSINGRDSLLGRRLYDRFRSISKECLLGHFVVSDEYAARYAPQFGHDVVSYKLLKRLDPNVIYLEGGLFEDDKGTWRIPRPIAEKIVRDGTVMIVADAGVNELNTYKKYYKEADTFLQALASYKSEGINDPERVMDEVSNWKGVYQIICKPEEMVIDDWLRPVYHNINEILVGLPVRLAAWKHLVASGNQKTTKIASRERGWPFEELISDPGIFASAANLGNGYVVFIAGKVSHDVWAERCPDNITWLTNLAEYLLKDIFDQRLRASSHFHSPHLLFLSHRSIDIKLVDTVADEIKRQGIDIWFDQERLVPSDSLIGEINQGLEEMSHFVLFWSRSCVGASWVKLELETAVTMLVDRKLPILVVRLDDTPVPAILAHLYRIEAEAVPPKEIGEIIVSAIKRLEKRKRE